MNHTETRAVCVSEEEFVSSREGIEDFYTLTPLQQGMLFHSLYAPQSDVYIRQMIYTLREALDAITFRRAWERVVQRHPSLRMSIRWEDLA